MCAPLFFPVLAVRQQQHHALFQGSTAASSHSTLPGQRPQALPLRSAPTSSTLSAILGAGARRREDVGTTRTFGSSSTGGGKGRSRTPSAILAKPLLPSAMRASGRTTVLSSTTHPPSGAPRRETRTIGTGKEAAGTAAVGGAGGSQTANTGRAGGGRSRPRNTGDAAAKGASEDLLKLPWAYGSGGSGSTDGPEQRSSSRDASAGSARGATGGSTKVNRAGGVESAGSKKKPREGALGKAARPPEEAHPAGYTNGSVVVPAESKVFSQMPQRFPARADGSRTAEGARKLADVEVKLGV